MTAFERVLLAPHSVAARRALAEEWKRAGDARAQFIELQIREHEGLGPSCADRILDEIRDLVRASGREWAGRVGELVKHFTFELGLVSRIVVDGDVWVNHAHELVRMAPLIQLVLAPPMDLGEVAATKELLQIRTLASTRAGQWLNDDAIERFARSAHIRNLRAIHFVNGQIGPRGMAALMRSPYLRDVIYITVTGNPGASTPGVVEVEGGKYILGTRGKELLGAAIDATAFGYSGQVEWPPAPSTYLFDNDG